MYIAVVPNRSSPPAILLRESFREGGKVKNRTLANLSDWSSERVEALRAVLRGRALAPPAPHEASGLEIVRSWPHGHIAAVLGTVRRLDLERLLAPKATPARALVVAMLVQRLVAPGSKLATARGLARETRSSTLSDVLALPAVDEDDLYSALDWLLPRQGAIEQALARRHLSAGQLVLYDVTSTYFEGRRCPLAKLGHSRDGKRDKLQIVFGVLTNGDGCPVVVVSFKGNTGDPKTLTAALTKVRQRFGLDRLILVGDRGMLTAARKRQELLAATERALAAIAAATQRPIRPLRGPAAIGLRVGAVLGRHKVGKHFTIEIAEGGFRYARDAAAIAAEAALDGLYVIRTSVGPAQFPAAATVQAYKRLAEVERAFRSLKTVDLHVRPIHHRKADRVRAHVFLCLLAFYVEWHMRQALKPLLFDDEDKAGAAAARRSIVAPAQRSPRAQAKAATKRTEDGWPVHSFQTLLADLATMTKNQVRPSRADRVTLDILATPTAVQRRAFELLRVSPRL